MLKIKISPQKPIYIAKIIEFHLSWSYFDQNNLWENIKYLLIIYCSRRIPFLAQIFDKLCQCPLKRHQSPKSRNQSQTEQTLIDSAASKANLRRNGNKPNTEAEVTSLLHHNFTNCLECKRPSQTCNGEQKWKGIYKRRPSGLPLVNRAISEQDTLLLQTYSLKHKDKHRPAINSHSAGTILKELSSEENGTAHAKYTKEVVNGIITNSTRV